MWEWELAFCSVVELRAGICRSSSYSGFSDGNPEGIAMATTVPVKPYHVTIYSHHTSSLACQNEYHKKATAYFPLLHVIC